jgi:hypothetical protein
VNLEGLTEKVGSLGLQRPKRNRSGAAKRRTSRAKREEAPSGESASSKAQQPPGCQLQKQNTSCTAGPWEPRVATGPGVDAPGSSSSGDGVHPKGPGKR